MIGKAYKIFQIKGRIHFLSHYLRIYGVESNKEQEKIKQIAEKLRKEVASKPIVLRFFRQEIWETKPDGSRQPHREQEYLERQIRIE